MDGREALGVAVVYLEKAREALLARREEELAARGEAIVVEPVEGEDDEDEDMGGDSEDEDGEGGVRGLGGGGGGGAGSVAGGDDGGGGGDDACGGVAHAREPDGGPQGARGAVCARAARGRGRYRA